MTTKTKVPSTTPSDIDQYPFLVKTLVTFTQVNSAGNEEKKKEDVVFKLDQASAKMPWYALRNFLVPKYLTNKYGPSEVGWQRIYEIRILKQIKRSDPNDITDIPLRIMTREQLSLYCKKWELNVPVEEFYSVEKAREMVALRELDEKGYLKHLAEYREGKQRNFPELDTLRGKASVAVADAHEFDQLENKEQLVLDEVPNTTPHGAVATEEDIDITKEDVPQPADNPFAGI